MSFKASAEREWHGKEVMKDFDKAMFKSLSQGANLVLNDAILTVSGQSTDTAQLVQSLTKEVKPTRATVGTNVKQAPFVEFGTRPHRAPFDAIKEWVIRKGIDPKAAWPIWKKIATKGIKAKPFLLPALTGNIKKIIAVFAKNNINLKWVHR